ncbi:B12-binding domain-containing radical SAM protein [Patescibacteria group bacterium]|nr:B12-binding domain-containing radical SAM protein [Patescibacteria group bacterium]
MQRDTDVLLINPNSKLINNSWGYRRFCTPIAPLGLCYIAAVLRNNGLKVSVIDQYARKMPDSELIDSIKKQKPFIIGFSALTPVMPDIRRLVLLIRKSRISSKIVLGNIHATCFPEEMLKDYTADIVVRGEGETTMLELCNHLMQGKQLEDVAGISFRLPGGIRHNPERRLIDNLDALPFPAWDALNLDDYSEVPLSAISNSRAIPIMASRGCPYRCYYCSQDTVYAKVRYRDLNKVVDEIEYFLTSCKIRYFGFSDAYFPFDEESGLKFCNIMIKRGLHKKLKWCTETRVDKVSPGLLKAMKEAGVHLIMYGIEVGNKRILKSIHKGTTLEQARIAVQETKKAGILSQGLFMLGLPGETKDTCMETITFAKEIRCDLVKFNIAVPYPGSKFFEDFIRHNKKVAEPEKFTSWSDWTSAKGDLVYCPEDLDSETLRYLQRRAMFDFYVRPRAIMNHILQRTVTLKNLFLGFLWLASMLLKGIIAKSKNYKNKRRCLL